MNVGPRSENGTNSPKDMDLSLFSSIDKTVRKSKKELYLDLTLMEDNQSNSIELRRQAT